VSAIVVIGSQWGDEGKGKLVDAFATKAGAVVRFQGGANAGHTLIVGGKKTVLHLVPSGILHPHCFCLIASGVTLDPFELYGEIQSVKQSGALQEDKQLLISDGALLVLPFHRQLDLAREANKSANKIGTTGRGIGPSYEDRASRRGLLFRDLFAEDLKEKLSRLAEEKNFLLQNMYDEDPIEVDSLYEQLKEISKKLEPYRCKNPARKIDQWLKEGRQMLFEGAQGVLLDNVHGTYPYVTSSSTSAAAACVSSGLSPRRVDRVLGITKAYCTRVGVGPFPTELFDKAGETLQEEGHEFGATTGRRRRCGWLDLVALRYAVRVSGIDTLVITKLDVLSHFDSIKVCTSYKLGNETHDDFSLVSNDLDKIEPQWTEFPGWKSDITSCLEMKTLPVEALKYLEFIEKEAGVPISVVSVGPDRDQTIYKEAIFKGAPVGSQAPAPAPV